jgi:ribosome-associated protein
MAVEEIFFEYRGDHIELQQLLKALKVAPTGGVAKMMIRSGEVLVNGEVETRRSRKLRAGDVVQVGNLLVRLVRSHEDES